MGLPPYFSATTLRTLVATGGQDVGGPVVEIAKNAHIDLRIGPSDAAVVAGRLFVELAARTFGSLAIEAPSLQARTALQTLARDINHGIASAPVAKSERISVALQASRGQADIVASGAGWWVGLGEPPMESHGAVPLGPLAAAVLSFNAVFVRLFGSILAVKPPPMGPGWSLLDWSSRPANEADLVPIAQLRLPRTALVGCGAIGHAIAYTLGHLATTGGPLDLIDPQTLSGTNLQRYVGTQPGFAEQNQHKVLIASRLLPPTPLIVQRWAGSDWARYRSQDSQTPELVFTALDSAAARRAVQASLPKWIINAWTRTGECGATLHDFIGPTQCLACTYLPRDASSVPNDYLILVKDLGIDPVRVVHLVGGAALQPADLRAVEQHRSLPALALARWRGESVRSLYGQLCGVAELMPELQESYVVPLPQASVLAGILAVAQAVKLLTGERVTTRPLEVSLMRGPGPLWELPAPRKDQHSIDCVCKDREYLLAYQHHWGRRLRPPRRTPSTRSI